MMSPNAPSGSSMLGDMDHRAVIMEISSTYPVSPVAGVVAIRLGLKVVHHGGHLWDVLECFWVLGVAYRLTESHPGHSKTSSSVQMIKRWSVGMQCVVQEVQIHVHEVI